MVLSPYVIGSRSRHGGDQGLTNVTFELCDATQPRPDETFDVVVVFNAVHD